VRFDGANFVLLDGSPLPKLQTGTTGELVLRAEAIQDQLVRARFTQDDLLPLLDKGSRVFVGVGPHLVGNPNVDGLLRDVVEHRLGWRAQFAWPGRPASY